MNKFKIFFCFTLLCNSCTSQSSNINIQENPISKIVYIINLSKRQQYKDGTYSYSFFRTIQISSEKQIASIELQEAIKKKILDSTLNDTVYIDSNSLVLDDVKYNDINLYNTLKLLKDSAVNFKFSDNYGRSYYASVNTINFSYSISIIKGEWSEIIIPKELGDNILGRNALFFNDNASDCHVFVLTKQLAAYHLTNL